MKLVIGQGRPIESKLDNHYLIVSYFLIGKKQTLLVSAHPADGPVEHLTLHQSQSMTSCSRTGALVVDVAQVSQVRIC